MSTFQRSGDRTPEPAGATGRLQPVLYDNAMSQQAWDHADRRSRSTARDPLTEQNRDCFRGFIQNFVAPTQFIRNIPHDQPGIKDPLLSLVFNLDQLDDRAKGVESDRPATLRSKFMKSVGEDPAGWKHYLNFQLTSRLAAAESRDDLFVFDHFVSRVPHWMDELRSAETEVAKLVPKIPQELKAGLNRILKAINDDRSDYRHNEFVERFAGNPERFQLAAIAYAFSSYRRGNRYQHRTIALLQHKCQARLALHQVRDSAATPTEGEGISCDGVGPDWSNIIEKLIEGKCFNGKRSNIDPARFTDFLGSLREFVIQQRSSLAHALGYLSDEQTDQAKRLAAEEHVDAFTRDALLHAGITPNFINLAEGIPLIAASFVGFTYYACQAAIDASTGVAHLPRPGQAAEGAWFGFGTGALAAYAAQQWMPLPLHKALAGRFRRRYWKVFDYSYLNGRRPARFPGEALVETAKDVAAAVSQSP